MTPLSSVSAPAPTDTCNPDAEWWRQAAVYQIYPRSFADADGNGIGDLRGIVDRVPYLRDLGIDAVWLSPFYPSALADGGYDVDDYRNVDPRIGTLADFDVLVSALHDSGIRVIVDLVPNHTSDRHAWFKEALAAPKGSPARARFLFRDGRGEHGELPPTDWPSLFGGSVWERVVEPDGSPGQWYFHFFAREQPDLNWDNPEVQLDFEETIRFWADRGVDGFRVDVAHGLKKDIDAAEAGGWTTNPDEVFARAGHPLWDRDDVHAVYSGWRRIFNEYDPPRMGVAEVWVPPQRVTRYASPDGLGQAFNFDLLKADFEADRFREVIDANLTLAASSGASSTWVLSNHDVVRHVTRYGLPKGTGRRGQGTDGLDWLLGGADPAQVDLELGLRRARAATLLMLALPGSAYIYQGEELGLPEVGEIRDADRQDPIFFRNGSQEVGRDGCRVPLPWEPDGESFGFGQGGAHLPQPAWFAEYAASRQAANADSTLSFYRRALALRQELVTEEDLAWLPSGHEVLHFARPNGWQVVMNFGEAPVGVPAGEVLLTSGGLLDGLLPGACTIWLRAR